MKMYIYFTGGSEDIDFLLMFSYIYVLFSSKVMSGQLNIESNSCDLTYTKYKTSVFIFTNIREK